MSDNNRKAARLSCFFYGGQKQLINDEMQDFHLLIHLIQLF